MSCPDEAANRVRTISYRLKSSQAPTILRQTQTWDNQPRMLKRVWPTCLERHVKENLSLHDLSAHPLSQRDRNLRFLDTFLCMTWKGSGGAPYCSSSSEMLSSQTKQFRTPKQRQLYPNLNPGPLGFRNSRQAHSKILRHDARSFPRKDPFDA